MAAEIDPLAKGKIGIDRRLGWPQTHEKVAAAGHLFIICCSPKPSHKIEPIQVHHLVPRGNKIRHELFPGIVAAVYLGICPKLRV